MRERLTDEIVELVELAVVGGQHKFAVDDAQLGAVLERMSIETEQVEHAPERPDVDARVYALIAVQVEHLGRPIHGRGLFGDLVLDQIALVRRPRVVRLEDVRGGAAEVAQLDLVVRRHQEVLQLLII